LTVFNIHVARKLKDQWYEVYGASFDNFSRLFFNVPATGNWSDLLVQWYTELAKPDYVHFVAAYTLDPKQFPVIAVTLENEEVDTQYLGFEPGTEVFGLERSGIILRLTVKIHIIAKSDAIVNILHEFVRQAMIKSLPFFQEIGYIGLQYLGGSDMQAGDEFMPELLGAMRRDQTWTCYYEPVVANPVGSAKDVFVHAVDVTIGGLRGKVSGSTED
jgi:hypothetical protein